MSPEPSPHNDSTVIMNIDTVTNTSSTHSRQRRLQGNGVDQPSPFEAHLRRFKARKSREDAFTRALDQVFASPGYERWATEPILFWAPLLALCMGIRPPEVTRIALEDVVECDGVACITFRDGSNLHLEKVESTRSRRRFTKHSKIPVPQALLDAGFMSYVAAMTEKGEKQLFPCDGQRSADQRTAWLRSRFARQLRSVGIASGGFPELRRSYEKRLRTTEVSRDRIAELLRVADPGATFFKEFFVVSSSRNELKRLMDECAKGLLDLPRYPSN